MQGREMGAIAKSRRLTESASIVFEWLGVAGLACMVLITAVDVLGDVLLGRPLPGVTELVGLLQVVAVAGGLAFSKVDGRQINVGFVPDKVRGRLKAALEIFSSILVLGFWGLACWFVFSHATDLQERGTGTFLLAIPHYPFVIWIGIACCVPMFLLVVWDLAGSLMRFWRGDEAK